jgi:hypothetical protein
MVAVHGSPPSRINRDADDVAANTIQVAEVFAYTKTAARAKKAELLVRKKQTWRPGMLTSERRALLRHGLEAATAVDMHNALEVLQRRSWTFSLAVRREEIDRRRECPWPELI